MRASIYKYFLFWVILLFHYSFYAQDSTETINSNGSSIYFYPYVFYTPETKFAIGAAAISYFRSSEKANSKPSKITLSAYYSVRKQYDIILSPELYFKEEKLLLSADFVFGEIQDKFWGVGNQTEEFDLEDYQHRTYGISLDFQTSTIFGIKSGGILEIKNTKIIDKKENPFILSGKLLGSDGGMISGAGVAFSLDHRNNIFYPSNGGFYEVSATFFGEKSGSDFSFNRYLLNLRQYASIAKDKILALQIYGSFMGGSPPFYELSALGGQNTLRGYFQGRYRDNHYLMTQTEYRTIIWWRIGVVGFLGFGDVASKPSRFNLKELKYSYGLGVRFVLDKVEKLNVRMDVGFGKNSSGLYFAIEEAF
jgi:hypothetical protein